MILFRRWVLREKKCGPVHKVRKVEVERRDACVVRVTFYSLMRSTSSSLHWEEKNQHKFLNLLFINGTSVSICHVP